jgi:hypothetical protein
MGLHRRKNELLNHADHFARHRLGWAISSDNPRPLGLARHQRADSRLPPEPGTDVCARPRGEVKTLLLRSRLLSTANDRHVESELNLVLTAPAELLEADDRPMGF